MDKLADTNLRDGVYFSHGLGKVLSQAQVPRRVPRGMLQVHIMAKSTNVGKNLAASKPAPKTHRVAAGTIAPAAPSPMPTLAAPVVPASAAPVVKAADGTPAVQSAPGTHGGVALAELPKSLAAKGTSLGQLPTGIAAVIVKPGRPFKATSAHNAVWAAKAVSLAAQPNCSTADLVKAGVPSHSVAAYLKRGWLVKV